MKKKNLLINIIFIMILLCFILANSQIVLALAEDEIDLSVSESDVKKNWQPISAYSNGALEYPGQWSLHDNSYIVNAENTSNLTGFYNPKANYSDIEISMNMGSWDSDDDYLGCMIRFSEDSSHKTTGYVFILSNTATGWEDNENAPSSGLYKIEGKQFKYGNLTKIKSYSGYWEKNAYTNVKLVAKGSSIKVYINGTKVIDVTDSSIKQGSYGFFSLSQPDARFKDITGVATLAKYTVTFNPNGGTVVGNSTKTVISTKKYGTLPSMTRIGYTTDGHWHTSKTSSTYITSTSTVDISSDTTFYAQWTANTYTVKYNGNGATGGSTANSSHTYDKAKNLNLNGYERKYAVTYNHNYSGSTNASQTAIYNFVGWANSADGIKAYDNGASVINLTATNNGTVNLYAMWTSASVTYVPTRTGYIFGGWYKDAACTNSASGTNGVYTPTANITLYAKWTPITYTVVYNGNGATGGSTANSSHTYDVAKALTANGYERKYTVTYNHNYSGSANTSRTATYTFKNWNLNAAGTGNAYNNRASVINLSSTNGAIVNLYAQWTSSSVTYVPTRTGYIFGGWYTDSSCTNQVAIANGVYTPTGNITLYAKWTPITYTVKYNGNGATGGTTADSSHIYDVSKNLTSNGYERKYTVTYNHNYSGSANTSKIAAYGFNGWSTLPDGPKEYNDQENVMNLSATNGATVNLYAVWDSDSVSYTPSRTGYTFLGWFADPECTNKIIEAEDTTYIPTSDIELYAGWKINKYQYKVEYYFNGYIDKSLTVVDKVNYLTVIDSYENKIKDGYKLDTTVNLPLTVTEKEETNVIKIYYKTNQSNTKTLKYYIFYYIDGKIVDTRAITRSVQVLLPNKILVDKNLIDTNRYSDTCDFVKISPDPIPEQIDDGDIISVYYESKISQVVVKYVDKVTEKIISEETIEGKVGETYSLEAKEIEGYTLIESPERTGTITEEAQEKVFYYAKNAEVKVKYLEKDTGNVLADEEIITGYEGKEYETTGKEIENYELVDTIGIPSGIMSSGTQEVIYYYAQKTKVTVNHIDVISGKIFETETISGIVGDEYSVTSKDFEGYVLEEKPEQENGRMTKDEIVLNYYYKHVSAGVVEKHIDKISGEILDNILYEGNEGDLYETSSKEFEGYDLDETILPENSTGTMTKELIEVKYYYVRKAQVKVQYLDRNTNEAISEEIVITGHEGDSYTSEAKTIEDYYLVESMLPTNAEGTMTKDEIIVTYYYAKKSAGVIEKHINEKTEEVLEEKLYEGLEGDDYKIDAKEFEGYDLDNTKLPENSQGKMTEELIEVDYYYIRKAYVKVEYIDELTDEIIEQEVITGHEGDSYKTTPKEIKNYTLDGEKIPDNKDGIMTITVNEDGTVTSEIVVKYYYKKISAGVLEKHIDIKTNDVLEEKFYSGNVGDTYKTTSKEYEKYDLVTSQLPENAEGTMTEEQIEVDYYYIRKTTVRVEYVDNETGKKVAEDTIIEGHEDDEYKTEAKEIKDYTLDEDKLPENSEGTMKVVREDNSKDEVQTETVVTYYYDKVKKPDENKDNNNTDNTKPDNKPNNNNSNENNKPSNNENDSNNINSPSNNNSNSGGTTIIIKDSSSNSNTSSNTSNGTTSTTSNTSSSTTTSPSTGDIVPVVALGTIILVGLANIIQAIISKRKKK